MNNDFPHGLFVMRHCRTEYNAMHKISGQIEIPIVDHSINTTAFNIASFEHQNFIIISSPLGRCVQTVSCLLQQYSDLSPQIYIDHRIIERGMGAWEGEFKADILQKYPKYNHLGHINPLFTPPQGETIYDFIARIDSFIQDLEKMSQRGNILICAHNQSLKLLKYRLNKDVDLLDFWISNNLPNGKIERLY